MLYLNFQLSCLLHNQVLLLLIRLKGLGVTAAKDGLFQIFYPVFACVSFLNMHFCLYLPCYCQQASSEIPKLRKEDQKARNALLADIQQGTRLRKVTQINDRSAPQIESESAPQ